MLHETPQQQAPVLMGQIRPKDVIEFSKELILTFEKLIIEAKNLRRYKGTKSPPGKSKAWLKQSKALSQFEEKKRKWKAGEKDLKEALKQCHDIRNEAVALQNDRIANTTTYSPLLHALIQPDRALPKNHKARHKKTVFLFKRCVSFADYEKDLRRLSPVLFESEPSKVEPKNHYRQHSTLSIQSPKLF